MTTQPRGLPAGSGIHPSPPQVIPGAKYGQNPIYTNQHQSYSPRHFAPSSPLQQAAYYPQAGATGSPHDMSKNQGVAGTPPSMMMMHQQPFFRQNGHRQRAPMPPNNQQYYYQQPIQRYPGQQPAPPPPTSPSYYPGPNNQFQYVAGQHIQQQQPMYSPAAYGTSQQYSQPPPQPQMMATPIQTQPGMHQPQSSGKRARKIITIKDPNTNKDMTDDILMTARQASSSTPPSGRSSATPPNSDIPAQFAAKVMAAASGPVRQGVSPLVSKPLETVPVMIPQNPQMAQQMLTPETQIVGSPNIGGAMMTPTNTYMTQHIPPSSSPRPHMIHSVGMTPHAPQMAAPYVMPAAVSTSHMSPQILSSSPSRMMVPPRLPPPNVNMSQYQPSVPEHQTPPPTGYQLPPISALQQPPPQQYAGSSPDLGRAPVQHQPLNSGMPYPVRLQQPQMTPPSQSPTHAAGGSHAHVSPQHGSAQAADNSAAAKPETAPAISNIKDTPVHEIPTGANVSIPADSTDDRYSVKIDSQDANAMHITDTVPPIQNAAPVEQQAIGDMTAVKVDVAVPSESDVQTAQIEPSSQNLSEQVRVTENQDDIKPKLSDIESAPGPETGDEISKALPDKQSMPVGPTAVVEPPAEVLKEDLKPKICEDTHSTPPRPGDAEVVAETKTPSKTVSPLVNVVPPTPPSSAVNLVTLAEDASTPVPSAKSEENEPDLKTDAPAQISTSSSEDAPSKPSIATPDAKTIKPGKKEATNITPSESESTPAPQQRKPDDKTTVVVNGNASGTSPESEAEVKDKKVKKTIQSTPKSSKNTDTKPSVETPNPSTKEAAQITKSEKPLQKVEKTNGVADKTSKPELKYREDQWSPLNPDGKRKYDSSFLLQFQYKPTSLEKPKDLPNIDIVLDQPHNQKANPMQPMQYSGGGADFTPPYMQRRDMRQGGRNTSAGHRRPSGRSGSSMGPKVIQKVVSIDRSEAELKRTANAWKPLKLDNKADAKSSEELETMEVLREVRAILNKLTPSKFTDLMKKVLALKIDTEAKLRGAIDLIFEKAIDEPNFSEAYANMCRNMTNLRVTAETTGESQPGQPQLVEFRKLLLTRCQREFEKNKSDQEHLLELKTKMEQNTDQTLAPLLKEEYEVAESKERRRNLGNIRFIGELFKLHMLTESIMHSCIMSLFKARDDDHLESLCRLLTTIGKDLDHAKAKTRMDQYFEQVQKIVREKKTSSRVRFMLQDVFDLRLNSWVPRAVTVTGPKTISQIHQDAKEEQDQLQLSLSAAPSIPAVKPGNRQTNRIGSRGHGGDDGWTKVPGTQKPIRYDPSKMKLKTNQFDESKVKLGPSSTFGGWKSGSGSTKVSRTGSAGYSPSSSMDRTGETARSNTPTNMMNRFSALSQSQAQNAEYEYQKRQGGRQSSREGTRTGSRGSATSSGGRTTPRKDERASLLETARKLTSADRSAGDPRQRSRDSSPSVNLRPSTPQTAAVHKYNTELDEDKMETKCTNIMKEFCFLLDFKEATECIDELNAPPTLMHALVFAAHEFSLEKSRKERINTGKLMVHLLKLGRISVKHYLKGVGKLVESATDYELDVPKVWEYLAEQISPVFEDQAAEVSISSLAELSAPLLEERKSGVFVSSIFRALLESMTISVLSEKWTASDAKWEDILGIKDQNEIKEFLTQNNLTELQDTASGEKPSQFPADQAAWASKQKLAEQRDNLERALVALLKSEKPNEVIFDWVEENVQLGDRSKPTFLRALTTSICKNAIGETLTVNKEMISARSIVLQKFLASDPETELQALFAVQELMVFLDQPPNILRTLFDVLYDEDVISENTFYNWEHSTDPNEQEGRGVALAAANPFFTWLRQAEPESD